MANGHLAHRVAPLRTPFFSARSAAPSRTAMASTEIRLREALAREEALRRELAEVIRQQDGTSRKLFAWRGDAATRVASLSPQQRKIMDLVLAGQPSKNIAADLGISQRTVEKHRATIMKKTGATSLPALARLALAATWIGALEFNSVITMKIDRGLAK